jgi:hypothetical protein
MANGSVTLGEVAACASHIDVACSRCDRRGRYRLTKLIASLGEDFRMTDLGAQLAACPKRGASVGQRCDVYFPGLRNIMSGNQQSEPPKSDNDDNDDD